MGPAGAALRLRRPAARGALRYSPWGRAAELASLAACTALEQLQRVGSRSARDRAPTPGLRCWPPHAQPGTGRPHALRERTFSGKGVRQAQGIEPAACRAPQARVRAGAGPDARRLSCSNKQQVLPPRQAARGCALARLCGGEERRVSVGARTRALREPTRRSCSSAVSAANEASLAARPRPEHRSAVGAFGAGRRRGAPVRTRARLGASRHIASRPFKDRKEPTTDDDMRPGFSSMFRIAGASGLM
jgi:hypothetical protein